PPALEAVCLRAMAKKPEARYATATDLAREVQRFLADEPVEAWREPMWVRAARWARRHKTAVAAAAAVLIVSAAGLAVSNVLVRQEGSRTRAEWLRAEQNFRLAFEAVDEYYTRVSESKLLAVPGLQPLRQELLGTALEFYRNFARERHDDRRLRS